MEGRWTIHWKAETNDRDERVTAWMDGPGVHADVGPVPVVPCDDAAIERGQIGLIAAPYDWRTYAPAIVAQIVLMAAAGATDDEISEFVLRAAGENTMSPSATTIDAATPRCPVGPNQPGELEAPEPCDRRLSYYEDREGGEWTCPMHGHVTTPESLVHRQGGETP